MGYNNPKMKGTEKIAPLLNPKLSNGKIIFESLDLQFY